MEAAGFEQYFETVLRPRFPWLPDWVGSVDWVVVIVGFAFALVVVSLMIGLWALKRRKRAIENPESDPYGLFVQRVNVQKGGRK